MWQSGTPCGPQRHRRHRHIGTTHLPRAVDADERRPSPGGQGTTVFLLLTALVVIAGFAVHWCTAMSCRPMNCTDSLPVTCARFLCQQSFLPVLSVTYCINNITYDLNPKALPANTGSFASPTIPMSATQTNGSDCIGMSATCMPRMCESC